MFATVKKKDRFKFRKESVFWDLMLDQRSSSHMQPVQPDPVLESGEQLDRLTYLLN